MTPPVFQRMRTPKPPPVAKPLNRPRIRVTRWREKADELETRLRNFRAWNETEYRWNFGHLEYMREWIKYAEAILNDGADSTKPFNSTYHGPWIRTANDPRHVHPVVRLEDFLPTAATP